MLLQRPLAVLLILLASAAAELPAQTGNAQEVVRLANAGTAALGEEKYGTALVAFSEAVKLSPRDPSLRVGAGYAAAMLGRLADARSWLEGALTLQPRLTQASSLLGEVLHRQGNLSDAVAVYEAALKYAPGDKTLTAGRDKWRQELNVSGRFYEARGVHFSVLFEGPADDIAARRVVEILEQGYQRIGSALSTYPTEPVTVVLYTRQQFRDITRSPAWAGGAYDGRIKIPMVGALDRSDDLRRILEHEFVHALVATLAGPTVPAWLNEGLAAALEPGGLQFAEEALKAERRRLSYAELERGFGGLSASQAAIAYAQSAVAVKKLMDLRGAAAVVALLRSLGQGVPFESAFQSAIFMRLDELQALMSRL